MYFYHNFISIIHNYYQKIYSDRYSTDCYCSFFKTKTIRSKYELNDLPVYTSSVGSIEDFKKQKSYFFDGISNMFNLENNIDNKDKK